MYMNYLNQIKINLVRLPLILGAMVIAYFISIHFGWQEPVEYSRLIPTFFGGIISYIFIVPLVNKILLQTK